MQRTITKRERKKWAALALVADSVFRSKSRNPTFDLRREHTPPSDRRRSAGGVHSNKE